ncbi:VanZ family protein [Roseiconus lacunae]|uniref:VanZ-like domain-containing protein n=1 Tax=Roseiconus lacunae TaxID=2605694 RepID=A0ABT7PQU3_9BACT|nr:VanZ family protein [Roseiconus lacunae]MDM4018830.1 hypothetical protein [Roseiconus lacunae]
MDNSSETEIADRPDRRSTPRLSSRALFGWCVLGCSLALAVGSWAPFQFRGATLIDAWDAFISVSRAHRFSRSDFAANLMLGIPISFCILGWFGSTRNLSMAGQSLLALLYVLALSVCCELGQAWIVNRTPSCLDMVAQALGALIGVVLWWRIGTWLNANVQMFFRSRHATTRGQAAAWMVACGILLWTVLPLDVLISPVEIAQKWAVGRIELVPFTLHDVSYFDVVRQALLSFMLAIPLGVCCLLLFGKTLQITESASAFILSALATGVLPELIQVPIASRVASATDALFGTVGAAFGLAIGRLLVSGDAAERSASPDRAMHWPTMGFLVAVCYFVLLCLMSWYPFEFVTDKTELRDAIRSLQDAPFADFRGGSLGVIFSLFRVSVLSAILGALLGVSTALIKNPVKRKILGATMLVASLAAMSLLELGLVLEASHHGGGLGLLCRFVSLPIGFFLGVTLVIGDSRTDDH